MSLDSLPRPTTGERLASGFFLAFMLLVWSLVSLPYLAFVGARYLLTGKKPAPPEERG